MIEKVLVEEMIINLIFNIHVVRRDTHCVCMQQYDVTVILIWLLFSGKSIFCHRIPVDTNLRD